MADLEVKGVEELSGQLLKHANLEDVKLIVRQNGVDFYRATLRDVPVDKGPLKQSLQHTMENGGFTAAWRTNMEYAPDQEWGTRYQPGTPFMRFNFARYGKQMVDDLSKIMKK